MDGPLLFSKGFPQQACLHAQVGTHPLHPPVLVFQSLHPADQRRICYPAGFCKAKAREGVPPYFTRLF